MPNLRSAQKRVRIERKRYLRNKAVKSTVRTAVTNARGAIAATPETAEAIRQAISELDRAVSKGVLHRNNAARRKSRLMARLHKAEA